jgi:ubiquinone/menaquinone biosynthesis C-methylase UbiE
MSDNMSTLVEEVQSKAPEQSYEEYYEENGACGCTPTTCGCSPQESETKQDNSLPVQYRILREGDRVVEFGTTEGIESLSASHFVGEKGKVIGICESNEALNESWTNLDQLKVNNVEFRQSSLTKVPLPDSYSNIVLGSRFFNKTEDKDSLASEIYRVCEPGGMICLNELVYFNDVDENLLKEASTFTNGIEGIEKIERYLLHLDKAGFSNVQVVEMKKLMLPESNVSKFLDENEVENFQDPNSYEGIFSISVIADKPGNKVVNDSAGCCGGSCGCG